MSKASSVKKGSSAMVAAPDDGGSRSGGARPQLLSQLPQSMFTSPGFIAGIVAFELLYALFLFAVMSSSKRNRHDAGYEQEAYVEPAPALPPRPIAVPEPTPASKSDAASRKADAAPVVLKAEEKLAKEAKPPVKVADASSAPAKKPRKTSKKGRARTKNKPKQELAAATPNPPAPAPAPVPPPPTSIGPLGALIDPLHDTRVSIDADAITFSIPGNAHIFDPNADEKTAPRALTEVEGDFVTQVKVLGNIRPGTKPLSKNVPLTFQGAGLLIWQDNANYVRAERTASYSGDRVQQIRVETCKDGKPGGSRPVPLRNEAPIILRVERKGSEMVVTYSYDGKSWLPVVKSMAISFPAKVSVGISASNLSPRPFSARFEQFTLNRGGKDG